MDSKIDYNNYKADSLLNDAYFFRIGTTSDSGKYYVLG